MEAAAECSVLQAGPGQTGEKPDQGNENLSSLLDAFEGDLQGAEGSLENRYLIGSEKSAAHGTLCRVLRSRFLGKRDAAPVRRRGPRKMR